MVKYYVKITDEQPSDDDGAVWFELESGSDEKGEFFALRRNEYEDLVDEFETIKSNFESEYVQPIVENKVDNYLNSLDSSVPYATNSENLVNPNDNTQKHTWSSINNNFTTLSNNLTTLNGELANKVDSNTVTSLQTTLNNKAQKNHTHSTWTKKTFNSYCSGYVNTDIRIVVMRYIQSGYNFTKTSAFKLHSGLFKDFKPVIGGDVILNMYNAEMGGYVDNSTGDMYVYSRNTGKKSISCSAMWRY